MNIDTKFSIKYLQNKFNNILKISYITINLVSFQGCKNGLNNCKSMNEKQHIKNISHKNHIIISNEIEKNH
jgi:hypothetical protein